MALHIFLIQRAFPGEQGFCEANQLAIPWYKVAFEQIEYFQIRQLILLLRNFSTMLISDWYFDDGEQMRILTHFQPEM